jgi:hypothetical protein
MKKIDQIPLKILFKYTVVAVVLLGLWATMIFHFMFWILMTIIQEFKIFLVWLAAPTRDGAATYWAENGIYWIGIYCVLLIAFVVWYFVFYRHKRPYLDIGGGREGRVLWIKGLRRGLSYDVWDAKNYIAWKLKKNPLRKIPRRISDIPDGGGEAGIMWPDPLAIPLGRRTSARIIYYSRPWRLTIERLIIPNDIDLLGSYLRIQLPEGYIINRPDPLFPGEIYQVLIQGRPSNRKYKRGRMREDLMDLLDGTKDAVQKSAAANPQLIHRDYEDGSFPLLDDEEVTPVD